MQDVVFGSEGTAQADFERMEEINREIGLTAILQDFGSEGHADQVKEKLSSQEAEKDKLDQHKEKA